MSGYHLHEKKRRTKLWIGLILLTLGTLGLSIWLLGPSPPKKIKLATGPTGGAYAAFGKDYQERLRHLGLEVELVPSKGSIENLQHLARGEVQLAFAQGGTYELIQERDDPNRVVRGMASLYLEPLWIFHQRTVSANLVSDFKGKKISIGLPGSGTAAVSELLLREHGITSKNSTIIGDLNPAQARQELNEGRLDVALLVASSQDENVQDLLRQKQLVLMNFRRQDVAHARRYSYLQPVHLTEGLISLQEDIPKEEVTLLAPAALLVCREDLHPQVIEQLLKVAQTIHARGNRLDPPNRFPSLDGVDIPLHPTAEAYLKSGQSWMARVLPYWGVRLVYNLRVLILPLLAIWLPFLKILPMIYTYRINSILKKHYAALRDAESAIVLADTPEDLRQRLPILEHLRTDMETLSRKVPAHLQAAIYHWRLHVALVHTEAMDRLRRMEGNGAATDPPTTVIQEMEVGMDRETGQPSQDC